MTSHHSLGMHTVFLARENIAYLKEWIVYHALLGVQHFYLYDNTGSIGAMAATPPPTNMGSTSLNRPRHSPTPMLPIRWTRSSRMFQ